MQPDLDRPAEQRPAAPADGGAPDEAGVARWCARRTGDGSYTLAHPVHGETCHSDAGAWQEARERYALPCALAARAAAGVARGGAPVRLLDVGTGIGLNLAAALAEVEAAGGALRATSLELDSAVIAAGLALPDPLELAPWCVVRATLREALADPSRAADPGGLQLGERSRLRLLLGDARETLLGLEDGVSFDAVLLDPFSPRREPALWEPGFLAELARRMAPGSVLSTYSAARSVRTGLAAAGLAVEIGPPVGRKREGTLARRPGIRIGAGNRGGTFA